MCEYRNVKGYRPADHMVHIMFEDGKEALYLPAAERIKWFNAYKNETGTTGTINEERAEVINTPAGPVWIVDASVTLGDECYHGRFMRPILGRDGSVDERAFSTAYTKAIGRALAHAGFGQDEDDLRDGHDQSPLSDAPVVMDMKRIQKEKQFTSEVTAPEPVLQSVPTGNTASATESAQNTADEDAADCKSEEMTLEEAKAVVIAADMSSSKGNMKGKTMGELLAIKPSGISYIAKHPEKYASQPKAVHDAAKVLKPLADKAIAAEKKA